MVRGIYTDHDAILAKLFGCCGSDRHRHARNFGRSSGHIMVVRIGWPPLAACGRSRIDR
jgi:hypothetical protein